MARRFDLALVDGEFDLAVAAAGGIDLPPYPRLEQRLEVAAQFLVEQRFQSGAARRLEIGFNAVDLTFPFIAPEQAGAGPIILLDGLHIAPVLVPHPQRQSTFAERLLVGIVIN